MAVDQVRWGVLSTANIGRKAVTPAIQQSKNSRAVAVASRSGKRAEDYARELDIERSYGSYDALLSDGEVDAVYIPLPNSLHKPWTIKACEAGKHVLCEKPLALNAKECRDMVGAARQNGVKLMEAFMYRFHPRTEQVLSLLQDPPLDVKLIRSAFTFAVSSPDNIRLQADLGGGSLMDVGCYCVNVARTMLGKEPLEVQAFAEWAPNSIDEAMVATLCFEGNVFAQFHCALNTYRQEFYEVVRKDGRISVTSAFLPGSGDVEIRIEPRNEDQEDVVVEGADEYQLMVEHFASCILTGLPLRYDASEAAANMSVIEALYRSARNSGHPEAVRL